MPQHVDLNSPAVLRLPCARDGNAAEHPDRVRRHPSDMTDANGRPLAVVAGADLVRQG
ncbi:hypothetical protein [Streptomyces griseosporeus]